MGHSCWWWARTLMGVSRLMPHIVHSWRWGAKPDTEYIVPNGWNTGWTIHFPLIPAKSTLPSPYRPQFFNHVAQIHSSTYWSRGSSQSGLSSNDWFPNKRCSDHGSLLNLLYHQTVSHLHTRPVQPTCLPADRSLSCRLYILPYLSLPTDIFSPTRLTTPGETAHQAESLHYRYIYIRFLPLTSTHTTIRPHHASIHSSIFIHIVSILP